jgi:hypothetical protein
LAHDLHAGDARRGVGNRKVRQLADILGYDGIDDLLGVALDVAGRGQALTEAGDDDLSPVPASSAPVSL